MGKLLRLAIIIIMLGYSFSNAYTSGFLRVKVSNTNVMDGLSIDGSLADIKSKDLLAEINIDSVKSDSAIIGRKISQKRPETAFMIALVPGFLVHGMGNYYAGDNKTGSKLLAAELAGVLCFMIGAGQAVSEMDSEHKGSSSVVFGVASLWLFFGSWIIDMGTAPGKVRKANEAAAKVLIYPKIERRILGVQLSFFVR